MPLANTMYTMTQYEKLIKYCHTIAAKKPLFFVSLEHKMSEVLFIINYLMRDDGVFFNKSSFKQALRCLIAQRYANELARMCFLHTRYFYLSLSLLLSTFLLHNCVCVLYEFGTPKNIGNMFIVHMGRNEKEDTAYGSQIVMNYIDYEYLSVWINEYQRISRGHRIYAAFFYFIF